mgnify:CR=1 FL=1
MKHTQKQSYKHPLLRVATFELNTVLNHVFTRQVKKKLRDVGVGHDDKEWKETCVKRFPVIIDGKKTIIPVTMESHRYQLFAEKGIVCKRCGLKGTHFALEKHQNVGDKYHFNLYGITKHGEEVMLTKDHIIPRSKGGKNKLDNYQTLCIKCNSKKSDSVENVKC